MTGSIISTPKGDVRVSPEEAALIARVERCEKLGQPIPSQEWRGYLLLMEAIGRVSTWKARNERTKT